MPIYSYKCLMGHEIDRVFPHEIKPQSIKCQCGKIAKAIINTTMVGSCWPEGRRFEHVADRTFKNYSEVDKFVEKNGSHVEVSSLATLKVRQEERAHNGGRPKKPKPKKLTLPDAVDKAFRYSPTVESAMKALKEGRVK